MKSVFTLCWLPVFGFALAQACGSDDGKKQQGPDYSAQGGDGAAGDSASPSGGNGENGGSTTDAGAPSLGGAAGAPNGTDGGTGGAVTGGGAGEGAQGTIGGQGGQGGQAGGGGAGAGGAGGAGELVTCEIAPTCTQDLANIGTGDFSISFTITTSAQVSSGIVAQRQICMHSKFWDVRVRAGGTGMSIETDDQVSYTSLVAPTNISDGAPHEVRICRKSGMIYAFTDGVLDVQGTSLSSFGALPAFASKTSVCGGFGTVTLDGTLADVCVGAL